MSDNTPTNVVSFRVVDGSASVTTVAPKQDPQDDILGHCVDDLHTFLTENKERVRYFVCGVAVSNDMNAPNESVAFHMFTSPMSMPDLAMTIKMFENSLFSRLNSGDY